MEIRKAQDDAYEAKMREYESAQLVRLGAMVDYIAMMAEVELPEEEVQHEREV